MNVWKPVVFVAAGLLVSAHPADALEVLGVTIPGTASKEEKLKSEGLLPYTVQIVVGDGEDELTQALSDASLLVAQSGAGVADVNSLIARARSDEERLQAALFMEARYGGQIKIEVAGIALEAASVDSVHPNPDTPLHVRVMVTPGPQFRFGRVEVTPSHHADAAAPLTVSPGDYGLVSGEPARSIAIVAASEKLVEAWRHAGFPFARVVEKDITADHAASEVNVLIAIEPGEPAVYGWINVTGARDLETGTIARQSKLRPGEPFTPQDLQRTRDRLRKLESVESVRIIEGEAVDDSGGVPITLEVTERKVRYIGATASYSTIDGAELHAYWGHRNVFGNAERFRADATISQIGSEDIDQLQFDAGAIFAKPGILDIDTDLFSEFRIKREHPDTYESLSGTVQIGLARVFTPEVSGTIAVKGTHERVEDAFGRADYTNISLPADLTYDTRDSKLDPTRGMFAVAYVSPTAALSGGASFVSTEAQVAAYQALDPDRRIVLAGRIFAGSIMGASQVDVPASVRYFAGGGGSVRGYEHRTLGPEIGGEVVGGRSMVRASAEVRLRITDTIGIVPFIDAASVSAQSFPQFSDTPFIGAGLGLRYYTAIGPLRLDFAVPVNERDHQPSFAFYVGLGQAF